MRSSDPPGQRVPRIGDIVLYHHFDAGRLLALAALVTDIERLGEARSAVSLTVFRPGRSPEPHHFAIPFAEEPTNGCWSWRRGGESDSSAHIGL
jgi:hypothetical protein